jgi:hypothetical protein
MWKCYYAYNRTAWFFVYFAKTILTIIIKGEYYIRTRKSSHMHERFKIRTRLKRTNLKRDFYCDS